MTYFVEPRLSSGQSIEIQIFFQIVIYLQLLRSRMFLMSGKVFLLLLEFWEGELLLIPQEINTLGVLQGMRVSPQWQLMLLLRNGTSDIVTRGESSDNSRLYRFCKYIWHLDLPNKLKLFIWKAYHNGTPVGSELQRRFGVKECKCIFCDYISETSIHLFKDCWWIKGLRISSGLSSDLI